MALRTNSKEGSDCPNCASGNISRCRRSGIIDRVIGISGLRPHHCSRCYGRFYKHASTPIPSAREITERVEGVSSRYQVSL
jgi:hypothetical protein